MRMGLARAPGDMESNLDSTALTNPRWLSIRGRVFMTSRTAITIELSSATFFCTFSESDCWIYTCPDGSAENGHNIIRERGITEVCAGIVKQANDEGLKIPSVEVQGFESLSPHHSQTFSHCFDGDVVLFRGLAEVFEFRFDPGVAETFGDFHPDVAVGRVACLES